MADANTKLFKHKIDSKEYNRLLDQNLKQYVYDMKHSEKLWDMYECAIKTCSKDITLFKQKAITWLQREVKRCRAYIEAHEGKQVTMAVRTKIKMMKDYVKKCNKRITLCKAATTVPNFIDLLHAE